MVATQEEEFQKKQEASHKLTEKIESARHQNEQHRQATQAQRLEISEPRSVQKAISYHLIEALLPQEVQRLQRTHAGFAS